MGQVSHSVSVSVSISVSLCVSLCLSVSLCLPISLSLSLSVPLLQPHPSLSTLSSLYFIFSHMETQEESKPETTQEELEQLLLWYQPIYPAFGILLRQSEQTRPHNKFSYLQSHASLLTQSTSGPYLVNKNNFLEVFCAHSICNESYNKNKDEKVSNRALSALTFLPIWTLSF